MTDFLVDRKYEIQSRSLFETATIEIRQAEDEYTGEKLSDVKIYLDGVYTNHYTPHNFTFREGEFGTHTFTFSKPGWEFYLREVDVTYGMHPDDYIITPTGYEVA